MLLRPRRIGSAVVIGVAVATLTALAVSARGFPVQHVSVNDGSIWVTDNQLGSIGRFTKPIAQLDGTIAPASTSTSINVWQSGPVVVGYDASGGRLYAVNVYGTSFFDAGAAISPAQNGIALNDTTLAVLSGGALRATQLSGGGGSLDALSASAKPLAAHLPAGAAVAVGSDDTIWVAGGGQLRSYPQGGKPQVSAIPLPASDPLTVTTVGNVPVIADPQTKTLYLPDSGRTVPLPPSDTSTGLQMQQQSGSSDIVAVATASALYTVSLGSGQLSTLSSGHTGAVAAPVQLAGCVHAAWASGETGSYVRSCGSPPPAVTAAGVQTFALQDPTGSPQLVFRVDNGAVVLNDTADGYVFLLGTNIQTIKPKWVPANTAGKSNTQAQTVPVEQRTQLTAKPYTQGVRPGTTTVVHVLDADKGPAGLTYAVTAVGAPDQHGVTVSVAPDSQTVLATVTSLSTDAHFQYTIDDGHGHTATGEVTLVPRSPAENAAPVPRPGYVPPSVSVAAGGTVDIPVTGSWRDFDGDPLYIDTGSVRASAGSAAVTSGGALSFTAPQTHADETVTIDYGVSDGRVAKPTPYQFKVSVIGSASQKFIPPVAEPDAAQGVVGAPLTLQPLANDLPGVDPTNPSATLALAAPVPSVPGATVVTDTATGTVTFTAQHPGDFFLSYTDAYGAAPTASGTIRVHVIPAAGQAKPPVTTPDVAVLHGQQPAVVDVLADDFDPQGLILGVTSATTQDSGVHVAVIDQRWLRISADNPQPGMAATVQYTVGDGVASATGTVAVSAVPADPNADQITTTPAAITIRSGDSAAVPVLAGDASSIGLPIELAGLPPTVSPPVAGLHAGIEGTNLRVDAPAGVSSQQETTVSYVATDATGTTATGDLTVTIEPPPSKARPDQAPAPQEVDTRGTAGDVTVIHIPVDGIDPDGDSVTVTGVIAPPALGRIVGIGPDTISYQSYPGSSGTDTFTYQVTDPYGLSGTANVRIAVLPPGPPQPPVAVDDVLNAPPGASLHWNVLGNDYIAPGDTVTVEPLTATNKTLPAGVRLAGPYVYLQAPSAPSDPPLQLTYGATDGSTPSLAQVIVHAVPGAKIPPIANDDTAPLPPPGAATVTVNVLKHDDDPVGSPGDLKVSWAPAGVTVNGPDLTIRLAAQPREVPYQVTAPDGLTATAVVYVPGTTPSAIRVRPGARIRVNPNGSVTVPLSQVLEDTNGLPLKITTTNRLQASPQGQLSVSANQATAFQVHAVGGYTGPGAVTVQVYDGTTMQSGQTATLTIPAQVGPDAPILRCPATTLQVVEGGAAQSYDIGQLCHVWVDTTVPQAPPHYTATWGKAAGGVSAAVPGGTSLQLSAASNATPGATGTLKITPSGSTTPGTLNVQVIKAPPPTGRAVTLTVDASRSVAVDLSQYVTSPLAQPNISVVNVIRPAGATVTSSGSQLTITPAHDTTGTIHLIATVTDVPGRIDRYISVSITATVLGFPGAPGQPAAKESSHTLTVRFSTPAANGAPIEYYTAYANGAPHQCPASPCVVSGLTNGTSYSVYVTATNSVGESRHSPATSGTPNTIPGQVGGLQVDQQPGHADQQLTLGWQPAPDDGTPVTGYSVEVSPPPAGGSRITQVGVTTSHTFTGLANGTQYTFTVMAANAQGNGPWSVGVTGTPFGKPQQMAAPTVTPAAVPNPAATRAITVSWPAAQGTAANGRAVTSYTVYEYASSSSGGPWGSPVSTTTLSASTTSTSFTVSNNSSWYEYAVTATNLAGASTQSAMSSPAVQAAAPPNAPTGVSATATGANNTIQVTFTPQAPNSKQISYLEYGLNSETESGTLTGSFTAGMQYSPTLTNAMNAGISNGTPVTVYIGECNDAGMCSWDATPSASVTPYGPLGNPTVTAAHNGTYINYTWGATSDGRTGTLNICLNGACSTYSVPATGNYSGAATIQYGTSVTVTITAYETDTAGQRAPASGTVSASATTTPPKPPPSVSISQGAQATVTGCTASNCYIEYLKVANFPTGSDVQYTCTWSSGGSVVGPTDLAWNGVAQRTDGTGAASFSTECVWGDWTNSGHSATISVTAGGQTASATYNG